MASAMGEARPSRRLVFWQSVISPHQSAVLAGLAADPANEVIVVVESTLSPARAALGWSVPDLGNATIILRPDEAQVRALVTADELHSVHIFSGLRAYPLVWQAFRAARATRARIGIMSEVANGSALRRFAAGLRFRLDAMRFGKRIDFVLSIGSVGLRWFRRHGIPAHELYPYGYFVPRPPALPVERPAIQGDPRPRRVLYVGRCVHDKGIDLLLRALHGITTAPWELEIIGDGPALPALRQLCLTLGVADRVHFAGALPREEVLERIGRSDLLVLPSRGKEGWGAVVNEALMQGVPVVCSDRCGAADLVRGMRGAVVPAGSLLELARALKRILTSAPLGAQDRSDIVEWSAAIEGPAVASYVMAILASMEGGSRPVAPWLRPHATDHARRVK